MLIQPFDGGIRVIDTRVYKVRKTSSVTLTDLVGDFQAGGTSFSWEDVIKVGTPNFDQEPVNPSGAPIEDTFLHCATKVIDINPNTNRTSVIYTLMGGVATETFPYAVQVPEEGMAQYLITFVFTL
ncbi:MAG: hypothetical protein ACJ8BF_12920 [Gemmatimonadales bacterium]